MTPVAPTFPSAAIDYPATDLLSSSVYWLSEVRSLAGVSSEVSRRYVRDYKGRDGRWGGGEQRLEGRYYATFRDLMELRFVNAFRIAGVSWRRILRAAEYAGQRFNTHYPFSHRRFQTDGADIFTYRASGLEQISQKGQMAFAAIIGPSLFDPVQYIDDVPARWYPAEEWGLRGVGREVMVDPGFSFGAPVVSECRIPTDTLYRNFIAEGRSAAAVARSYMISENAVEQAVAFDEELARRAAGARGHIHCHSGESRNLCLPVPLL